MRLILPGGINYSFIHVCVIYIPGSRGWVKCPPPHCLPFRLDLIELGIVHTICSIGEDMITFKIKSGE
jgi:hypothetical protein